MLVCDLKKILCHSRNNCNVESKTTFTWNGEISGPVIPAPEFCLQESNFMFYFFSPTLERWGAESKNTVYRWSKRRWTVSKGYILRIQSMWLKTHYFEITGPLHSVKSK